MSTSENCCVLWGANIDPRFTQEYSRVLEIGIRDPKYNPEYSILIGRAINDPRVIWGNQ